MPASVTGTSKTTASANSPSMSHTFHAGSNRRLIVGVAIRATTPLISGVTADGTSMSNLFTTTLGDIRVSFYRLNDADFPAAGDRTIACTTTGTDPKVAMIAVEAAGVDQTVSFPANVDSSSDGSPLDVSVTPPTYGGLVVFMALRGGASAVNTDMTGPETYLYNDFDFDFTAVESAYVIHTAAGRCVISTDISSANNFVAGSVAMGAADGGIQNNGLFFGGGF